MKRSCAQAFAVVLAVVLSSLPAGCINVDQISAGKASCSGGPCPAGLVCEPSSLLCVTPSGRDASPPRPDASADSGTGLLPVPDGGAPDAALQCAMPVPGCVVDGSKRCDPVCQSGCGCQAKCSSNTTGALTCNAPLPLRPKMLGEGCSIASLGSASQTDDCAPGLVCLQDACGERCYAFCRSDADCPGSTCTRDAGGGVKVCDVQATACNPIKNDMPTGCPTAAQACFLLSSTDRTACDCPGAGPANSMCSVSRDCFPGLACVDPDGMGNAICRPVCSLAAGANDCAAGMTCTPIGGSQKYGYCN